ncbi:MAG: glycosyltransferase involved in cell wall biosynthesis/ubiquinone [Moritella sp.]|jgi:glycosyltransferase involved in cell wall biosynthesis/ubiquinone/menaquinone biosynthesis C-methylase UbiE
MKICIIANNAYGALTGEDSGHIGGVERQTALLSEWLAAKGHQVSVITWNEGGDAIEDINGIQVIKLCKLTDGFPILRFFTPRWSSLISALKKADADLYYHNCAEYVTGQVAMWCNANKKRFIYTVASDADCEIDLPNMTSTREEYLFRYGLKRANLVITQTHKQKALLKQNYDIDATVINMPGTPPNYVKSFERKALFAQQKVIWVGRLNKVKRVEWLIDIAEKLPHVQFEVIGPCYDNSEFSRLKATENIAYLGKVSRFEMPQIYQSASILCCTSIYEGFPNTYLEAWSYGVPVITTIDPDNIIHNNKLGFHATTQAEFVTHINTLISDANLWEVCSENCEQYYNSNHEQNAVMAQFERVLIELLSKNIESQNIKYHFDQQSHSWPDYYNNDASSISHLDLQHRLLHTKNMLSAIHSTVIAPETICPKTIDSPTVNPPKLLDLGCGTGDSFTQIADSGNWTITGIDISEEMVKSAQANYPNIDISVANATKLPFEENEFSTVVALGLIEYISSSDKVIAEIKRVLGESGHLIISIPNKNSFFRKFRKLESAISSPLKLLFYKVLNKTDHKPDIFHQQWKLQNFIYKLEAQALVAQQVNYCTYGLLSPKLERSPWNIKLCLWLTKKLPASHWLHKHLANTIIIQAKIEPKKIEQQLE